jgi:hypothetical protein
LSSIVAARTAGVAAPLLAPAKQTPCQLGSGIARVLTVGETRSPSTTRWHIDRPSPGPPDAAN